MFKENFLDNNLERKEIVMKNTAEFRDALDSKDFDNAEKFLTEVASNPEKFPQYDDRWVDHRQRELFQSYYKVEDWQGTKRVVEATKDPRSYEGRKARLEELSKMKYDEI